MALSDHRARIVELIAGANPSGSRDSDDLLEACLAAAHRKHFFAVGAQQLRRRGQTLFLAVDTHQLAGAREKPGKAQWQAFCEGRPVSLAGLLKIDAVLRTIASHAQADVRELTRLNGSSFTLGEDSIVPSIYYAEPNDLTKVRAKALGTGREKHSTNIFGPGCKHTLAKLEQDGDARVTFATVMRMAEVIGPSVFSLFDYSKDAGPRNGESTHALAVRWGNRVQFAPRPAVAAPTVPE